MPELHDALDAEARRRQPRDQPPLSHLVRAHRRRRARRRVLAGAAAVAVLAGAAVGGGAVLQSFRGQDRLEGAPSSAAPNPAASAAPSATPSPDPAASPAIPCRDQELAAVATGAGAVSSGFTGATIRVTNVGLARCRLPERPVSLATVDTPLPTEPAATDHGGPQTLAPGSVAAFEISSVRVGGSGSCPRPAPASASAPPRLVMTFDAEPTAVVAGLIGGGRFVLACWPVQVGRMHLPAAGSAPGPDALWPAEADAPAAGACATQPGTAVVVETNPDVPQPRCVTVRPDQRIRVRNTSNRFGEPGQPVVVWFAGYPPRTVGIGHDTVFDRPAGRYLLPGVHELRLSLYRGAGNAEVWLQG